MTKIEAFMIANPADKRVVKINKLASRPMSLNGSLGCLIGELMRELEAV